MPVRKRRSRGSKSNGDLAATQNQDSLLKMTDSSALALSLLGNKSTSNTSGRRSERVSLPYQSDSQDTIADNESSDEADNAEERKQIRETKATEKTNLEEMMKKQQVIKEKGLIIHELNADQLEQHYSQCIQLFSKNKVNVKNAFKLQLIDFMKLMMERKTDKSENLMLMGCTLDASAKIYSCRVENVYSNLIKFVKTCHSGEKPEDAKQAKSGSPGPNRESSDDSSDREDFGDVKSKKKDKKKTSKANKENFVKEPSSLNRKDVEMCYYRQHLPVNQNYFLESSTLNEGSQLTVNRPLFVKFTPYTQTASCLTIDVPEVTLVDKDNFEEKIPRYSELRSKMFIADDGPEDEVLKLCKSDTFTFDPDLENIAEIKNFSEISDGLSEAGEDPMGGDIEMDYDDCDLAPCEPDELSRSNSVTGDMSGANAPVLPVNRSSVSSDSTLPSARVSFTPVAMSRMLRNTSKKSDYSYFDDSKMAFMPSAAHWKIKPSKRHIASVGKTPNKRGKSTYLDFSSEDQIRSCLETILEDDQLSHKLGIKTTKDWFYKKTDLIFMPIIPGIRKLLLSLFKDSTTGILRASGQAKSNDQVYNADESILLNPISFVAPDGDDDDDGIEDRGGDYHPLEDWRETMDDDNADAVEPIQDENPINSASEVNVNDPCNNTDLVPQPFRVEKVAVKFAKAQKNIDIKKLKSAIWNIMSLDNNIEDKENMNNSKSVKGKKKEVLYSNVFDQIPGKITKEAAAQLSYPIAFMAILHLANEKNLVLTGNESNSDLTVSLASPP